MWWGVVILIIVGYGDVYFMIFLGKVLSVIVVFLGIGIFVLLVGIIVFGFVEEV